MATTLNWITWLSWIFAGIYYIVIICNIQSLRVAVAVIETASAFVADTKRLVFVPVLYFVIAILLTGLFIAGLICTSSIGDITADSVTLQSKSIEWSTSTTAIFWYMLVMYFWVMAFVMAMNEFVIIIASITWYYSDKTVHDDDGIPGDSDVTTGMWWSLRYHAGTLAFGSLIHAIVSLIRGVFEFVSKRIENASAENGCTKCLLGCMRCCLGCFDRFIRYINRNAYIYCALAGTSYCTSALNSFLLIMKNSAKFGFVEGIASCFMFIAKFFIAIMTTLAGFFIMNAMVEVSDPYGPLFVIFLLSYMVAGIFIDIFDTGSNTILQCYILDKEVGLSNMDHVPQVLVKFFAKDEVKATQSHVDDFQRSNQDDEKANHME